jgi:hypothetical protein
VPDDSTAVDSPQGGSGGSPASFPSGSAADAVAAADLQDSLLDLGYTEVTLEIIDTPRYERYESSTTKYLCCIGRGGYGRNAPIVYLS